MSGIDEYAAETFAGIQEGMADIGRNAVADIGDSYQEILMSNASINPPEGLTASMETVTTQVEPIAEPAALETDPAPPAPEIDIT